MMHVKMVEAKNLIFSEPRKCEKDPKSIAKQEDAHNCEYINSEPILMPQAKFVKSSSESSAQSIPQGYLPQRPKSRIFPSTGKFFRAYNSSEAEKIDSPPNGTPSPYQGLCAHRKNDAGTPSYYEDDYDCSSPSQSKRYTLNG